LSIALSFLAFRSIGQSCSATITSDVDFSSISWTAAGGADCSILDGSGAPVVFNGDVNLDYGNSNDDVNMDFDLTINGTFSNTSSGSGNTLTIGSGIDIVVNGNMGDPNSNNLEYVVDGTLFVRDTLSGKNNNAFSGSGTVSGGFLDVKNGTKCPAPCPVEGGFDDCNAGDLFCDIALPIELVHFNAALNGDEVLLFWATSMEDDFSHFEIEHSIQGDRREMIGAVDGVGESNSIVRYAYKHLNPSIGLNSYRLKAVDIDGSFEFFGPESIEFYGDQRLKVYPNPVTHRQFNVELNFFPDPPVKVRISDITGRIVMETVLTGSITQVDLPKNISSGTYTLTAQGRGRALSQTIVIK